MKKALTTYAIAEHCQVTPRTVVQWINEGKLKAYRTPGNHSRVHLEDFLEFLKRYNIPIPSELSDHAPDAKKRILIVDDDRGIVDSISRFLIREKIYQIETAYDGFDAGQKFVDFKPHLILLDIRMHGIDGYQLCSCIRSNPANKNIRILIISGISAQQELKNMKQLGADDYLEKPFSNRSLKEKIESLLNIAK